jgi:hypothetical protein
LDPQLVGLISLAFAGSVQLALFSFLLGGLFQRDRSNQQRIAKLEEAEAERAGPDGHASTLVRLSVEMEHANKTLESLSRDMSGVHRQLANIATGRMGVSGELPKNHP